MSSTTPSLSQVAKDTLRGAPFSYALADFLDAFYRAPEPTALDRPPTPLAGQVDQGEVWDAFLGATGESLARRAGWPVPPWTATRDRFLSRPYFPITAPPFRATLLLESPVEFRTRNLFVTANALART
jgi:hypothetical protein